MRVLIAPDKFAGTLSAVEAAAAIAEGWRRRAPGDELDLAPMADGGPGFVDVLHATLGGDLLAATVRGPYGDPVPGTVLRVGDSAYVEAAQACGLHLTPEDDRRPEHASSYGVGELVAAAVDAGVARVVVGLGGTGTNDAGAGLLAALGATSTPPDALTGGPAGLAGLDAVDVAAARERVAGVELVAASDVDNPLLGLIGTTNVYGPQKGVADDRLQAVDAALERLAAAADKKLALAKGAGAAGGLGYALLLLGAAREPGIALVADAVGLPTRARRADLVVTGEGAFDFSSRSGKVPYGVAQVAAEALRPCIALAGQVLIGSREMRAVGIESAYSVADLVGQEASFADPAGSLAALAERTARTWSTM
ncbi:glycerate kinase [Nocardioides iriomotensis]|uniref:Glycerate kinase n=1 Tax=Nocardioides iriomotensis TaxID=715784 RepID=A0A4Q5IUI0_9ACTN|nr:glycerate kinase [Nocardioides iriomotensis]RYU09584.1 glycerate kinase [Nocardioides iriomotensis]